MKVLTKYLKTRISAITLILEQQQQSYTPDTFHTLRLEIKKLNALFNLVIYCAKKIKPNKTFKPFNLIFKQAGKIRELQVEETLLEEFFVSNFITQYREELKKIQTQEFNNFFLIINPSFVEKLQKKYLKINSLIAATNKKLAKEYMAKKRKEIKKLLRKKPLKKKKMHALRKYLKEYQFIHKILNYSKIDKIILKKDKLPELLGEWHDYQTVIQHLKKAIDSGQINPKESCQVENIITTFTFKSRQLYDKINITLPPHLSKNTWDN